MDCKHKKFALLQNTRAFRTKIAQEGRSSLDYLPPVEMSEALHSEYEHKQLCWSIAGSDPKQFAWLYYEVEIDKVWDILLLQRAEYLARK